MKLKHLFPILLCISLYAIYSSTFTNEYLRGDEWDVIGKEGDLLYQTAIWALKFGRPLAAPLNRLGYVFVGVNPARVQIIRFINWAGITSVALVFLHLFTLQTKRPKFSFLVVLFYFSTIPWQGLQGYSLQTASATVPTCLLSMLAFYLHFYVPRSSRRKQWSITFILLFLAMHTFQIYTFLPIVLVCYWALSDWEKFQTQIISYLAISGAVFIVSLGLYKIGLSYLHSRGMSGYVMGEAGLAALSDAPLAVLVTVINPLNYWSAFRLWSFPFPFHSIPQLSYQTNQAMGMILMGLWTTMLTGAFLLEYRQNDIKKWLAFLACFGFGATWLIVASPTYISSHRPHILMILMGVVVFSLAYTLQLFAKRYAWMQSTRFKAVALGIVAYAAFGAQSNVYRGVVLNWGGKIDFIRAELATSPSHDFQEIIVLGPNGSPACFEPCGAWFGTAVPLHRISKPQIYNYAMATSGIDPEGKQFTFLPESFDAGGNAVVIDWSKYVRAKSLYP
ncbi:MAG: hypothetical protein ACPG8W_11385 [Candidatus Promineifilaceae bacterium]